jgi:hypothetical protein
VAFTRKLDIRDFRKQWSTYRPMLFQNAWYDLLPPPTKSYPERRHWKINFENAMTLMVWHSQESLTKEIFESSGIHSVQISCKIPVMIYPLPSSLPAKERRSHHGLALKKWTRLMS